MWMRLFALILVAALGGCSFGGSDNQSEDSEVTSEGVDPSEDPFGALGRWPRSARSSKSCKPSSRAPSRSRRCTSTI